MNNDMSPSASPGELNPASGVRRVNNVPVYIFIGVVTVFVVVMVLVLFDQPEPKAIDPDKIALKEKSDPGVRGDRFGVSSERRELPKAAPVGIAPAFTAAEQEPKPVPKQQITIIRPQTPPPPPPPPPVVDQDAQRIAAMKQSQFEQAIRASTKVSGGISGLMGGGNQGSGGASGAPSLSQTTPTQSYKNRLAQLQSGAGGRQDLALATDDGYSRGDNWALGNRVDAPSTPFQLRAGFVIPGILMTGLNSEVPGQILGQVAQNVYDTPTGRHLLIPQGSRLIGGYQSSVKYGQSRMLVVWQRIVFPDGKALDIGNMPGSDSAGYAGLKDQVNNHYFRTFGSAILMSAITAGLTISQNDSDNNDQEDASDVISQAVGQQLGQTTADMIRKNLNIAPTIIIRPGYRFNISVVKDLTFTKPYQSFDY